MGPTLIVWVFAADDAVVVLVGFDVVGGGFGFGVVVFGGGAVVFVLLDMTGTR